jgi:hypothetical protein
VHFKTTFGPSLKYAANCRSCTVIHYYYWSSFKLLISISLTLVFLFNQVTDDLVVEIFNMFPFNTLPLILLLFRFECQFYEQLLKFFIAEVDAELLKTENNM